MKTKHTQGEWKWFQNLTSFNGMPFVNLNIAINHPDEDNICNLTVKASNQDEAVANAKLIAAAPELLEACQFLLNVIPDDKSLFTDCQITAFNIIEQAIKKATE